MTFATTLTEITAAASSDVVAFDTLSDRNDNTSITWNEGDLAQVGTGDDITTYVYDGPTRKGPFTSDADIALWKEIGGGGGGGGVPTAYEDSTRITGGSAKTVTLTPGFWKVTWRGTGALTRIQNGWGNIEGGQMTFRGNGDTGNIYIWNAGDDAGFDYIDTNGTLTAHIWDSTLPALGRDISAAGLSNATDMEFIIAGGNVEIRMVSSTTSSTAIISDGSLVATQIT